MADVVNYGEVLVSPIEVNEALSILGLSLKGLHDAIDAGEVDRNSCNQFNPPPDAGNRAHGTTVRALREILVPQGWTPCNKQNLATVVSPDETIEVAVASGDDGTGDPQRTPLTKYVKGESVIAEVEVTRRQLSLFRRVPNIDQTAPITWVLLRDRREEIVRCELSIPTSVTQDKRIIFDGTRIILPDLDLGPSGGGIRSHHDEPSSVDVTVLRRRA